MKRRSKPEPAMPTVAPWLLLIHQLPPKPAYLRVKAWRRLQALGAISVKNSVYVLPAGEQALEDFQWLLREIEEGGGEGMICGANLVDGLSDQEVRGLFDAARDSDYAEIGTKLRSLAAGIEGDGDGSPDRKLELKGDLARLRRCYAEVSAIDFFSATGCMTVEGLLTELESRLTYTAKEKPMEDSKMRKIPEDLTGKTWVTRRGVHVDRIACAWLIRRFIDPKARFKFVSMNIAEIVHDIDLKDGKFGREQTAGIAHVVAGICM
jgi:Chromate resistance exported protein